MNPFNIQEVLRPNETLLWQGQPVRHIRFTFSTICMVGFGIVMAAIVYACAIPSITYHETWTKLGTINFGEGHYAGRSYIPPDIIHGR